MARPSGTRRSRRSRVVVGALVAAAATVAPGCSGSGDGGTTTASTTSTTAPGTTTEAPGPPPGAVATGLGELEVGDCVDPIDDPTVEDLAVWTVPCSAPHTFEVYDLVEFDPGAAGDYPGITAVQEWAESACFDRFEAFVGVRWTLSELDIQTWWPSEESWERGDREAICAVRSDAGEPLTGTQRGSGR